MLVPLLNGIVGVIVLDGWMEWGYQVVSSYLRSGMVDAETAAKECIVLYDTSTF